MTPTMSSLPLQKKLGNVKTSHISRFEEHLSAPSSVGKCPRKWTSLLSLLKYELCCLENAVCELEASHYFSVPIGALVSFAFHE